jgi:hypothetical protein
LAAIISVPVFVWLGHWLWLKFADDFAAMEHTLARTHTYTLWGTVAIVVLLVAGAWLWKRRGSGKR